MDKLAFKKKVLEAAKEKQRAIVNDLQEAIDRRQEQVENDDIDYHNFFESTKEEVLEYIDKLADQKNMALSQLDHLERLRIQREHDRVTIGSILETDRMNFYISTGVEDLDVDGKHYFGISPQAPIYKELEGKQKGDEVEFRGMTYRIKDIY